MQASRAAQSVSYYKIGSCAQMIMHTTGIAAVAGSGRTKSSAKMLTLLHHLLITARQQIADTLQHLLPRTTSYCFGPCCTLILPGSELKTQQLMTSQIM